MKFMIPACAVWLIVLAVAMPGAAKKRSEPLATINFTVVRDANGKPVRNAAVVLHPVNERGRQERGGLELKTDAEGRVSYDGVPYGKLRIQVLATGFQTYGDDYDVSQPNLNITIKMKRPAGQYSVYEEHPDKKDPQK